MRLYRIVATIVLTCSAAPVAARDLFTDFKAKQISFFENPLNYSVEFLKTLFAREPIPEKQRTTLERFTENFSLESYMTNIQETFKKIFMRTPPVKKNNLSGIAFHALFRQCTQVITSHPKTVAAIPILAGCYIFRRTLINKLTDWAAEKNHPCMMHLGGFFGADLDAYRYNASYNTPLFPLALLEEDQQTIPSLLKQGAIINTRWKIKPLPDFNTREAAIAYLINDQKDRFDRINSPLYRTFHYDGTFLNELAQRTEGLSLNEIKQFIEAVPEFACDVAIDKFGKEKSQQALDRLMFYPSQLYIVQYDFLQALEEFKKRKTSRLDQLKDYCNAHRKFVIPRIVSLTITALQETILYGSTKRNHQDALLRTTRNNARAYLSTTIPLRL